MCFEDLDAGLAECAHVVFAEGLPKAWAKDAIFGACMYLPAAVRQAGAGHKLSTGCSQEWCRHCFLYVLCGLDRMAVCVFVCYAALLRASEALALRRHWGMFGSERASASECYG